MPDRVSLEELENDERKKANPSGATPELPPQNDPGRRSAPNAGATGGSADNSSGNVSVGSEEKIMVPPKKKDEDETPKKKKKEGKKKKEDESKKKKQDNNSEPKKEKPPKREKGFIDSLFDGFCQE